jgi:hypothetical protein
VLSEGSTQEAHGRAERTRERARGASCDRARRAWQIAKRPRRSPRTRRTRRESTSHEQAERMIGADLDLGYLRELLSPASAPIAQQVVEKSESLSLVARICLALTPAINRKGTLGFNSIPRLSGMDSCLPNKRIAQHWRCARQWPPKKYARKPDIRRPQLRSRSRARQGRRLNDD